MNSGTEVDYRLKLERKLLLQRRELEDINQLVTVYKTRADSLQRSSIKTSMQSLNKINNRSSFDSPNHSEKSGSPSVSENIINARSESFSPRKELVTSPTGRLVLNDQKTSIYADNSIIRNNSTFFSKLIL